MTDVDAFRDAEYIADVSGISFDDAEPGSPAETPSGPDIRRVRKLQSSAKIAFIDRLLRDLDILIYCELSALYYMEYAALSTPSGGHPARCHPLSTRTSLTYTLCIV